MEKDKMQKWLTPALMGAGLMIMLYIATNQTVLAEKMERALIKLEMHDTVLRQQGLLK